MCTYKNKNGKMKMTCTILGGNHTLVAVILDNENGETEVIVESDVDVSEHTQL